MSDRAVGCDGGLAARVAVRGAGFGAAREGAGREGVAARDDGARVGAAGDGAVRAGVGRVGVASRSGAARAVVGRDAAGGGDIGCGGTLPGAFAGPESGAPHQSQLAGIAPEGPAKESTPHEGHLIAALTAIHPPRYAWKPGLSDEINNLLGKNPTRLRQHNRAGRPMQYSLAG